MKLQFKKLGVRMSAGIVAMVLLLGACTNDTQRIRDLNEAGAQSATSTHLSQLKAMISVHDLRTGDCFVDELNELSFKNIEIVPCTADWEGKILSEQNIPAKGDFPGSEYLDTFSILNCGRYSTNDFRPSAEGWAKGDRVLVCVQQRIAFDEQLVRESMLEVGECFSESSNQLFSGMVKLESCTGQWEKRLLNNLTIDRTGAYPGEDYIAELANSKCGLGMNFYLYPTRETWVDGDRAILCLASRLID